MLDRTPQERRKHSRCRTGDPKQTANVEKDYTCTALVAPQGDFASNPFNAPACQKLVPELPRALAESAGYASTFGGTAAEFSKTAQNLPSRTEINNPSLNLEAPASLPAKMISE